MLTSLFEFGNCYKFQADKRCPDIIKGVSSSRDPEVIKHVLDAYSEDYHLGLWVTGSVLAAVGLMQMRIVHCYELKAYVMNILSVWVFLWVCLCLPRGDI